jgi:hypothetical protein
MYHYPGMIFAFVKEELDKIRLKNTSLNVLFLIFIFRYYNFLKKEI